MLEFLSNQYKTEKICDKAVNYYPSTILFLPECYKTQEMCDEVVYTCSFVFNSVPD